MFRARITAHQNLSISLLLPNPTFYSLSLVHITKTADLRTAPNKLSTLDTNNLSALFTTLVYLQNSK